MGENIGIEGIYYGNGHEIIINYELNEIGNNSNDEYTMLADFNKFKKMMNDEITFELRYSEDTLKVYPYKFLLKCNYKLEENSVIVTYTVENIDETPIHFSIGSHPAFLCPIDKSETFNDYYIEFTDLSCKHLLL